jgi:hypothetical protein
MTTFEERLEKAKEFNRRVVATGKVSVLATKEMINADELSPEQVAELVDLYPAYEVGKDYSIGDLFRYEGELIEVIQSHTSQDDWNPLTTASLYKIETPYAVIGEWVQPTGAHDSYNTGDKVIFDGKIYKSTIDGNTWSPADYPQGWSLVE